MIRIRCERHDYQVGKRLVNFWTNGVTTIKSKIKRGEGLYPSTEAIMIECWKCKHCGKSDGGMS